MAFLDDDEEIEHIVGKWAEALSLGSSLPRDPIAALQAMKFGKYIKDYLVVPDNALPNAKARYESASGKIVIRRSTYDAALWGEPAARWVVFEEIGHAALRHSGIRNFSEVKTLAEKHSSAIKRQEAEARRFAATMMAPFDLVKFSERMTVEALCLLTGMPKKAAEYRVDELDRISRHRVGKRRPIPAAALDFLARPPKKATAFEGDPCPNPNCGKLTMVRDSLGTKCLSCGTRTGSD